MLFSIFVNRRGGGVTTFSLFVNAVVLATFVPAALGLPGLQAVAVADEPRESLMLLPDMPPMPPQPAINQPVRESLSLLPEELMNLLVGGPVGDSDRCDLEDPRIILAQLTAPAATLMAQGMAAATPVSECTSLMESVLDSAASNDAVTTTITALPVLAHYPDSHEAKRALQEVESFAAEATATQLQDMATAVMNSGMEHQSAPEAYAACAVVHRHAVTQEAAKSEQGAYDAYKYVADAASRILAMYPNAPEAYRLAGLLMDAADYVGAKESVDTLANAQPGTLLAWRSSELQTGVRPPFGALQDAEAKYGLLAAWYKDAKATAAAPESEALRNDACALADEALWAHPNSAVQLRIAPLYFDLIDDMPKSTAAQKVVALTDAVNSAGSSMTTWICRGFLYREYFNRYYDFGTGTLQLLNMFDDLNLGFVEAALKDPAVAPRDKARIEYYLGYMMFNRGWERKAIEHYDLALAYDVSDEIIDTTLYAKAFVQEALFDKKQEWENATAGYWDYLAKHAYGRLPDYATFGLARIYARAQDLDGAQYFIEYLRDQYPSSDLAPSVQRGLNELQTDARLMYAKAVPAVAGGDGRQMCGPVALQKLLALEGVNAELEELASIACTDKDGTTMQGLVEAAKAKGTTLVGVQSARGKDLEAPFIAFVGGNHFVLVREVDDTGFVVDDIHNKEPEHIAFDHFTSFWDGKALTGAKQPAVARLLDMESLVGAKGGTDPLPEPTNSECKNRESCKPTKGTPPTDPPNNPPPPPPGNGGGGGGGGNPPTPPPGNPPGGPGSPGRCAKGYNPNVMPFQMSLETTVTDLSTTTAGGMVVNFTRNFSNQFGYMRGYYSTWPQDSPFKNNIGNSWNHSFNMHLRVSQYRGAVQFYDEMGDCKTYTLDSSDANYDYYLRGVTAEHEAHGAVYTGTPEEAGIVIKRNKTNGTYSMHFPDGMIYRFAQETTWPEHWAALTTIENSSGAQIQLFYDELNRLALVLMPWSDGRYLQFYYYGTTNRIYRVELRTTSAVIDAVYYAYDTSLNLIWVHRGDTQNPYNDINSYTYGYDSNVPDSYYMASMTDAADITTTMTYTYGDFGQWGFMADSLLLERGTSLKTLYTRSTVDVTATVTNLDANDDPVNKIVYGFDWYAGNLWFLRYYLTPTGGTYYAWWYYYRDENDSFLTDVMRPSIGSGDPTYFEKYTYTDEGQFATVERYAPGAPNGWLTTTFEYDTATGLLLTAKTGPDGITTEYGYDSYNRLVEIAHPAMGTSSIAFTYDSQGNLYTVTDPLDNTTTYTYDGRGNQTAITNALNQTTAFTYDDYCRVTSVTDPLNNITEYEYVDLSCGCGGIGKVSRITDPLDYETDFEYDALGNMIAVWDANDVKTSFEYDEMKHLTAIESPDGSNRRMEFVYNQLNQLVSTTDFAGRTTTMTYNYLGNVLTYTDDIGTVSITYNSVGLPTSVTDEMDHTTTFMYDFGLRQTFEYNAVYDWRAVFYDSAGRVSKVGAGIAGDIDPTEFIYNSTTGLHATTRYWTGSQYYDAGYEYDLAGRLTHIKDWINSTDGLKYEYDALGRPTKFIEYTGNNTQMTYTYDAAGRIATMTDYFSNTYSYDWTARGELESITRGTRVWEFAYNALGQRTQYTHPNGMRTEYDYDTWNRLTGIYHKDATTNAVLDSFEYTLNDGNEITRVDHADGSNWRYTYDDRGRLYWALRYSNGDTISDWYQYTYDDADNMTQYWRYYFSTQTFDTWDYVYNAANQQTSMTLNSGTAETRTYDDWGRMTARAQGSYSAAYSYRYGDRLRQVTSSFPGETATSPVYEYGGDGKMRRRGTEEIKYGLGFNPVAERTNLLQAKSFVYEPGKAVSERLAYFGVGYDFNQHYYNHDHLGSVRRTRSSTKSSVAVWDYEPYGKVHSGTANPLIFALHPYESGMRMHRAPYRNYSPAMARWTTVDPMGMVDGPNMYGYVGGDPLQHIDLDGRVWWFYLVPPAILLAWEIYGYAKACSDTAATAIDIGEIADQISSQNAMQDQLNMSVDFMPDYEDPSRRYRDAIKPIRTIGNMFNRGASYVGSASGERCKANPNGNTNIQGKTPKHEPYREKPPTYWNGRMQ